MRALTVSFALFAFFAALSPMGRAQSSADNRPATPPNVASEEEVNQLRSEVAAQRKTIEELKSLVEKLVQTQAATNFPDSNSAPIRQVSNAAPAENDVRPVEASSSSTPRLMNAVLEIGRAHV